jgi:CheY-like chemotaxis protein
MSDTLSILLVEDEADQASLVREVLEVEGGGIRLQHARSGEEAIAYLSGDGKFADREAHPFPFVMLLDLKMPGIGGYGVLNWLQSHPEVNQKLNTVVLSSVDTSKEIELAGQLGVKHYWVKSDCMLLPQRIRQLQASLNQEDPW